MQRQAAKSVDIALVVRNWLFGWYIVEFENGGAERAELYGKKLFKRLSEVLNQSGLKRDVRNKFEEISRVLSGIRRDSTDTVCYIFILPKDSTDTACAIFFDCFNFRNTVSEK